MKASDLFNQVGGELRLRTLVDAFYGFMDSLPEASGIRAMHPQDLTESGDKLFKFLVGWTGGPPLYVQEYGHPRLRARHLPFSIGIEERDQWMLCMERALCQTVADEGCREGLRSRLSELADFMRNKDVAGKLNQFSS
jgi:hemoglobin